MQRSPREPACVATAAAISSTVSASFDWSPIPAEFKDLVVQEQRVRGSTWQVPPAFGAQGEGAPPVDPILRSVSPGAAALLAEAEAVARERLAAAAAAELLARQNAGPRRDPDPRVTGSTDPPRPAPKAPPAPAAPAVPAAVPGRPVGSPLEWTDPGRILGRLDALSAMLAEEFAAAPDGTRSAHTWPTTVSMVAGAAAALAPSLSVPESILPGSLPSADAYALLRWFCGMLQCMATAAQATVDLRTTPGVAHFDPPPASGPTLHAGTDASKHGWGGLCESLGVYTAGRWTTAERAGSSTAHWEALAAVMLSASLAPWATGGTLHLACDSGATVAALNASRARDPQMHSLCQLFAAVQILGCFNVTIYHLPGRLNTCPDLLSRGVPASRLPLPRASRLRRLSIPHSIRWCGVLTRGQSLSPPSQGRPPTTPPSTPGGPTAQTSVFHAPLGTPWRWPLWQAPTPQPIPTTRTASTGLPTWGGCSATGPGANPSPSPATSAPFAATSY